MHRNFCTATQTIQTQEKAITIPQNSLAVTAEEFPTFEKNFRIPLGNMKSLQEHAFAVVHLGGTQHKLMKGDVFMTQKMLGAEIGNQVMLSKVLLIGTKEWTAIGTPLLEKARIYAQVEESTRTRKTIVFKKKRRKNYVRHNTHRQPYTLLRVKNILFDPASIETIPLNESHVQTLEDNLLLERESEIERIEPTTPILMAGMHKGPLPFPSTANPPPHWDIPMLIKKAELRDKKKIQTKAREQRKAEAEKIKEQKEAEQAKNPASNRQKKKQAWYDKNRELIAERRRKKQESKQAKEAGNNLNEDNLNEPQKSDVKTADVS